MTKLITQAPNHALQRTAPCVTAPASAAALPLPPKAANDALHIAVAAVNGIEYLVTWNCTHIANATLRPQIEVICRRAGYEPPVICTPRELLDSGGNP